MEKRQKPVNAGWEKTKEIWRRVEQVFGIIGKVLYHLRKVFLTVPVVLLALRVFNEAKARLPEDVGFLLEENGAYRYVTDRGTALSVCMAITAGCLVMMFCSRKVIYPWLISLFTLALPILLVVTNMFPA